MSTALPPLRANSSAFRFRIATPADLARCAELLPSGFRASSALRRQLPKLWTQLLASHGRTFSIIEDMERPHPDNIEGFGLSVFVTDTFLDEFYAAPRPYLAAHCYERMLAGDEVVMNAEQVRRANGGAGLNVVVLHFGLANEDLSDPRTAQVLIAGTSAFYFFHSGYCINAMANEVYGAQSAEYMRRGGFRLICDFQQESPAEFVGLPTAHYPYLMLLRREWVEPAVIDPMSQLFLQRPPRIGFSNSERRVLEGALLNESDAQIAARLGLSLDSVKKTWRNIYVRASCRVPNLIPNADQESFGSRGQEKRRHVLEYVRAHLQELRPSGHK
jgi:DNA-binding CsgD family transcriptional regulator